VLVKQAQASDGNRQQEMLRRQWLPMAAIVDSYPLLRPPSTLPRTVRRYYPTVHRYTSRLQILEFGAVLAMNSFNTKTPSLLLLLPLLPLSPSPIHLSLPSAAALAHVAPPVPSSPTVARLPLAPASSPTDAAHPVHASKTAGTHVTTFLFPPRLPFHFFTAQQHHQHLQ
jgi:hypothetical protein